MTYKFWKNVGVQMASSAGLGTANSITGISKANPAVVTYSGTDPANGNYVLFSLNGMSELNRRVGRVANVNAASNTFEIEGVDSTLFSTFASGSCQVVTFDRSAATLSEPQSGGGDPVFEDTTLIHDNADSQAIVGSSAQTYSFTSKWLPSDTFLIEANKAFISKTPRVFLITYADNTRFAFSAFVAAPMSPGVSGQKVSTPISLALEGSGTFFST